MTGNTRFLRATTVVLLAILLLASPALAGPLEKAKAAAKKEDWKTAAEQFAMVLDKTPDHREASLGIANAAIKAGLPEFYPYAEDGLLTLREQNARDWDVVLALGEVSMALSASKDDTLAKKSYDTQAVDCFETVLSALPRSEDAAAGLAQVHFNAAQFQKAVDVVDKFLSKGPKSSAKALFWKGQGLYFLAQDGFRASGNKFPLSDTLRRQFAQAQGSFRGATAGNPEHFEGWMQYAYASAWLSDREAALEGYRKALALDVQSSLPFRGIETLLKADPKTFQQAFHTELAGIVEKHPKHPQGLFYLAYNRYSAKQFKDAVKYFERYVTVSQQPAEGWYWMGKAADALGDDVKAERAYVATLKADPAHVFAAWELDKRIQATGIMGRAKQSVEDAQKVIQQYQKLLKLAPENASVRNNLAFTLREAYVAHLGKKKWEPILRASVKYYVEASDILGDWTPQKEATLDWGQRYAQAQIISDTGLMFQFYEATRDLDKAIDYYETALEYSDDGYRDAYNNYKDILLHQKRWDDAYELAKACAETIRTEQGQPDVFTRNQAKTLMKKLVDSGKVKP